MDKDKQKGVSLIITFFIMIIILSVVLSISALLYSEVKVIRNIGNSMASFYAADSGIEKVLYYDRRVIPSGATRGLCSMLNLANPNHCSTDEYPSNPNDHSIYCSNFISGPPNPPDSPVGTHCAATDCTDCTISFNTTFDGRNYSVTAKVYPSPPNSIFEVDSKGTFGSAGRQIQISTAVPQQ